MPEDLAEALIKHKVQIQYDQRPPYQRNDYIGWINRAKRPETRQKRIDQTISELKAGNLYMKMKWKPRERRG